MNVNNNEADFEQIAWVQFMYYKNTQQYKIMHNRILKKSGFFNIKLQP